MGASTRLAWLGALLVAAGPFAGYLLTRSVGLPGDHDDVGNWADPLGTVSLVVEGALILLAVTGVAQRPVRAADRRRQPLATV